MEVDAPAVKRCCRHTRTARSSRWRDPSTRSRPGPNGDPNRLQYPTSHTRINSPEPQGSVMSPVSGSNRPWVRRVRTGTSTGSNSGVSACKADQDVVRPDQRHLMSKGHDQAARIGFDRHHRPPRVEPAQPVLGHPFHRHGVLGQERRDRALEHTGLHPDQCDVPARTGQQVRQRTGRRASPPRRCPDPVAARRRVRPAPARARTLSASPISRYSASLAAPVGEAFAYEMRGWGEKPDEYAIGTPARRSARSKALPKSRWLVNRARPRLAYFTRSRCTGGACCSGWGRWATIADPTRTQSAAGRSPGDPKSCPSRTEATSSMLVSPTI